MSPFNCLPVVTVYLFKAINSAVDKTNRNIILHSVPYVKLINTTDIYQLKQMFAYRTEIPSSFFFTTNLTYEL